MSFIIDRQPSAPISGNERWRVGVATPFVLLAALTSGCGGTVRSNGSSGQAAGASGPQGSGGFPNSNAGGGSVASGGVASGPLSTGGVSLRLLTQAEYRASIQALFGAVTIDFTLPNDISVAGFISVGAAQLALNEPSVTAYEAASRAITAEVFADTQRWQTLVGCQPQADLSDACTATYIQSFGKQAFRRDLTTEEAQAWLSLAKDAAQLTGTAAEALAAATSGLLQSPHFLYRVEASELDASSGRLKYDGQSMATRLSYLLTGGPPSTELLAAAAAARLDTTDGVKAAAAPLLMDASAPDHMVPFFSELAQAQQVLRVSKSPDLFPTFNAASQSSMLQGTQLFIKNIVLAPKADVRSFFDSNQTFADATLAPIYGATAPASGFAQITLGPESGRVGILGQPSVLAAYSEPDRTSPTRRGVFIAQSLLCQTVPPPPAGINTPPPADPNATTRQQLEALLANPSCASCHALFDPLGFALEHLDPIGAYRATENGLPIDATGTWKGVTFDGEPQLGAALARDPQALACLIRSYYRDVNARVDDTADATQIDDLIQSLTAHDYVWRDLVAEFVASDAFRSAPALPVNP